MNSPIQFLVVLFLIYLTIKFKKLWAIYISVLIMSDFFGLVSDDFWAISDLNFKWFYTSFFILISVIFNYTFFNLKKIKSNKIIKLNYIIILFTSIQIISLILTFFKGYSLLSLIPFLEFVPFIFIIPLTHIFYNTSYKELDKLKRYIVSLTFLNCIIFLLLRLELIDFYDLNESFLGDSKDLIRSLSGWPIFLPIVFAEFYVKFNSKANKKIIAILLLFSLVILFSYTRSKLIAYALMIGFSHVFYYKLRIKVILKGLGILSIFLIITQPFFKENIIAFNQRFTSERDLETIDYRIIGAGERITKTLNENPLFGLGFIYKNDTDKLQLQYRSDLLIFPDMFWPNLISTTGLIGTLVFLYLLSYIGYLFFKIRHEIIAKYFVIYLVGIISLTFASGHIFFRGSIVFVLLTALHLALIYKRRELFKLST